MNAAPQLQAGVAEAAITPDCPLLLEGFKARQGPATGTLDDVEVHSHSAPLVTPYAAETVDADYLA